MSEKKMFSRSVVIGLGIVCIILGAFLLGTTIYFISTVNDQNSTINQKNSVITDLNDTITFRKYTVWVNNESVTQTAGNYTSWKFPVNFAGYIQVTVMSTTTNDTYIQVMYDAWVVVGFVYDDSYSYMDGMFRSYHCDNKVNLPESLVAVLPSSPYSGYETLIVEIRVGNTNTVDNATETVLVTYYY